MAKGNLSIHSENILPIIKKWLYSDKDIFLRELVSNACDAMQKLKILKQEEKLSLSDEELRIDIQISKDQKTISIADTGIGMTHAEVKKYITQIAFSGAEEFLKKYESKQEKDQIIGHFGLGFYSAYMVAKNVEILTKTYQEQKKAVHWQSDGNSDYTIDYSEKPKRGTLITLHIDEDSEEYLQESKLLEILQRYCKFLSFPIYLNGNKVNHQDPLWLKNPKDCTEKEYLEFYRILYPMDPDPVFWIHLNVDYPFHLKGILYFPKIHRRFDVNQSAIKLFCSRVFVSDNCKDLFPDYLTVMRGAIDSPDIPLNVSRSYLQIDRTVRQVGSHISKKICDRLKSLLKNEREKFLSCWQDVETIIKLGILQEEKFYERSKEFLLWKTLEEKWITLEDYLSHNDSKKIYYTSDEKISGLVDLYREKNIEVLIANGNVDTAIINFLESKLKDIKFIRIDSELDSTLLDPSKEKTLLDSDGKSVAAKIAEFVKQNISETDVEVEAKSLAASTLPAFIQYDEQARRLRDYMSLTDNTTQFPTKKTFVINTNHKLIDRAWQMKDKNPTLAKELIRHLYDTTHLSQREFAPEKLKNYVEHNLHLLEELLSR